jgi:hypothetical protein
VPLSTLMDMSVRAFDLAETLLDLEKEVKSWHDGVKDVWNVFGLCMIQQVKKFSRAYLQVTAVVRNHSLMG